MEKAVAAAHTFFVGNPEHMEMRQNLDYYQTMSGVKEADFKDLEAKPHMVKKKNQNSKLTTIKQHLQNSLGKISLVKISKTEAVSRIQWGRATEVRLQEPPAIVLTIEQLRSFIFVLKAVIEAP